jgi:hypothetical protein
MSAASWATVTTTLILAIITAYAFREARRQRTEQIYRERRHQLRYLNAIDPGQPTIPRPTTAQIVEQHINAMPPRKSPLLTEEQILERARKKSP